MTPDNNIDPSQLTPQQLIAWENLGGNNLEPGQRLTHTDTGSLYWQKESNPPFPDRWATGSAWKTTGSLLHRGDVRFDIYSSIDDSDQCFIEIDIDDGIITRIKPYRILWAPELDQIRSELSAISGITLDIIVKQTTSLEIHTLPDIRLMHDAEKEELITLQLSLASEGNLEERQIAPYILSALFGRPELGLDSSRRIFLSALQSTQSELHKVGYYLLPELALLEQQNGVSAEDQVWLREASCLRDDHTLDRDKDAVRAIVKAAEYGVNSALSFLWGSVQADNLWSTHLFTTVIKTQQNEINVSFEVNPPRFNATIRRRADEWKLFRPEGSATMNASYSDGKIDLEINMHTLVFADQLDELEQVLAVLVGEEKAHEASSNVQGIVLPRIGPNMPDGARLEVSDIFRRLLSGSLDDQLRTIQALPVVVLPSLGSRWSAGIISLALNSESLGVRIAAAKLLPHLVELSLERQADPRHRFNLWPVITECLGSNVDVTQYGVESMALLAPRDTETALKLLTDALIDEKSWLEHLCRDLESGRSIIIAINAELHTALQEFLRYCANATIGNAGQSLPLIAAHFLQHANPWPADDRTIDVLAAKRDGYVTSAVIENCMQIVDAAGQPLASSMKLCAMALNSESPLNACRAAQSLSEYLVYQHPIIKKLNKSSEQLLIRLVLAARFSSHADTVLEIQSGLARLQNQAAHTRSPQLVEFLAAYKLAEQKYLGQDPSTRSDGSR